MYACPGQQRFQVIGTPPRSIGGNEFGDGGLVAGSCQGKGERQCGTEQLIDPHSFFSEEPGQVDPVEKTDDAGDKTGDRQNQSTEDQRMTFGMLHSFSLDPLQIKDLAKVYSIHLVDRTAR